MKHITQLNHWLTRLIDTIQQTPVSLTYLMITFASITLVRNFLELYSSQHEFNLEHLIHYILSYVALAATFCALFLIITKDSVQATLRLIVPLFLIILIPPTVDLLAFGPGGQKIAYIMDPEFLLGMYLTFFGPITEFGITIGMRTAMVLILLGSLWFFYTKTRSIVTALAGTLLMYTTIFIYVSLPAVVTAIGNQLGWSVDPKTVPLTPIFFLIAVGMSLYVAYRADATYVIEIVKEIRPLRWIHFQLLFVFGVCLSVYFADVAPSGLVQPDTLLSWILVIISITGAWIFSVAINNLEDVEIDCVSTPGRLTVSQAFDPVLYRAVAWWTLCVSIVAAALVSFEHLFLMLVYIAGYFIYSAPPLRIKRVLIVSKGLLAFICLTVVTSGYTFLVEEPTFFVPSALIPTFLIFFTMAFSFIDLKDYEGDKQAGIKTLPVVLGMEKAKIIIGISFLLAYLSFYWIIPEPHLLPALLLAGLTQYFLITKPVWEEKKVLILHIAVLAAACTYLLIV